MAEDTVLSAELTHDTAHGNDDKRAVLHMSVNKDQDKILGYEIIRNGKVIAFTNDDYVYRYHYHNKQSCIHI